MQKSQQKYSGANIKFGSKDKKNLLRVYFATELQEAKRNTHKKCPALGASPAFESFDSNNNVLIKSHWKTPDQSDLHVLNNLLLLLYGEAGIKPLS